MVALYIALTVAAVVVVVAVLVFADRRKPSLLKIEACVTKWARISVTVQAQEPAKAAGSRSARRGA